MYACILLKINCNALKLEDEENGAHEYPMFISMKNAFLTLKKNINCINVVYIFNSVICQLRALKGQQENCTYVVAINTITSAKNCVLIDRNYTYLFK